jgi:integrase
MKGRPVPRKITPTVREAVDQFIESRRGYSPATQRNDRTVLRHLGNGLGSDRQIGAVTPAQVERYFAGLSDLQPSSFNQWRSKIRSFMDYAVRHGWVRQDWLVDVRRRREPKRERFRLAPLEMVGFLEAAEDPRDRAVVAVALNTGLRGSELTALRIRDADFKTGELYIYRTKSGHDDRLRMTPALERELRRWLTYYAENVKESLSPDMVLIPARQRPRLVYRKDGAPSMSLGTLRPYDRIGRPEHVVQRVIRSFGVEVGSGEGIHTLRRSVARAYFDNAAEMGYDRALQVTKALLGHSSVLTTERYLGITEDRSRRDEIMREDFLPFGKQSRPYATRLRAVGQN